MHSHGANHMGDALFKLKRLKRIVPWFGLKADTAGAAIGGDEIRFLVDTNAWYRDFNEGSKKK